MNLDAAIEQIVDARVEARLEVFKAELLAELAPKDGRHPCAADAAEYLGIAVNTLAQMRSEGNGPEFSQGCAGGRVQYRIADLDAWQAKRKRRNNQRSGA